MLFNAILNYDNLGVGRSEPPKPAASPKAGEEEQ
jgi:hypothetical protein